MKKYIPLIVCFLSFTSCEKEITLPYRSADPLYVIEGSVTNLQTEVVITRTRDMEDGGSGRTVDDAVVSLTCEDGRVINLKYGSDGYYRPENNFTGEAGKSYTLRVEADGKEFISESKMPAQVDVDNVYFRWQDFLNDKLLFLTLEFMDIEGEDNYYCYRIYRNGEGYRWNVLHDRGNDGKTIIVDIICMTEKQAKDNKQEDWEDILYEGDEISVELRTIDRLSYDYLFSLRLSERTSSNPIDNFSGGCLGYFSAYSISESETVYTNRDQ